MAASELRRTENKILKKRLRWSPKLKDGVFIWTDA